MRMRCVLLALIPVALMGCFSKEAVYSPSKSTSSQIFRETLDDLTVSLLAQENADAEDVIEEQRKREDAFYEAQASLDILGLIVGLVKSVLPFLPLPAG